MNILKTLIIVGTILIWSQAGFAQLQASGIAIPEFAVFDNFMQSIMAGNNIHSGVLAISKDGVVVYQRGFGIPENTPMRLASVSKTITAAAAQKLIADGDLNLNHRVFGLGTSNGILSHQPWQGSPHPFVDDVTVADLLNHQAGWNHDVPLFGPPFDDHGDPQFLAVQIAQAMGIPSPAGRDDIIRFMLAQPMQFFPGTNGCTNDDGTATYCYSNFAYMVLGRVVEEISGIPLHDFIRTRVITPEMWVANQELFTGRSLLEFQDPREPYYQCTSCFCQNVFDPDGDTVPCPYGGYHLEAFIGHGNLVASAVPLLKYMDNYVVGIQENAGLPIPPETPGGGFAGSIDGTNTAVVQRDDGINIVVLFSRRDADTDILYAATAANFVSDVIETQNPVFPTFAVDGYWVDFTAPPAAIEVGGFNHPYRSMDQALDVGDGAKIRLKPGATSWTGTITHKVIMDAPFGTATVGN